MKLYICIYMCVCVCVCVCVCFPGGLVIQNPPATQELQEIGGHGNPLKYSCLEKPMDRGAWQAIVHRV